MLTLTTQDIKLQQGADAKQDAIKTIASDLAAKGLVEAKYVSGMLDRENQNSTYLGNGIAIPHGTTDTRNLVKTTGVVVHHFPAGVSWGDGNVAYVAIGIAAKSDEHLGILKQLTKVLSADGVEEKLKQATTKEQIIALLNGEVQFEAEFDASLIQQQFPANDMMQLTAVAAGLIKNSGSAGNDFVAELITKNPTHLGHGLWLVGGSASVSKTAMSFVSTATEFTYENKPVNALISFAACNTAHQSLLSTLSQLIFQQRQNSLIQASKQELINLFSTDTETESTEDSGDNSATFTIRNAHGLHARPGAMLVAEAKKFTSTIKVSNLNSDSKAVNAKSLMKVIALGVKKGHELKFVADGDDASQALQAIGIAIESGLGES